MKEKSQPNRQAVLASVIVVAFGLYLVITSTFYPLSFVSVFDAKRILQLFLIAACAVFAVAWTPLRLRTIWQLSRLSILTRILLTLFFVIGIVSSLRLAHPIYALLDVSMLFLIVYMIAVIAASRDLAGASFDKWAVVALSALGLGVFIQELMGFVAGWVLGTEYSFSLALIHFAHPRFYNQLQTWSIPIIAVLPFLFPKKSWLKPACVILLGLQWFLVIAVAARGTMVSLVISSLFVAFWLPKARVLWVKTHVLGAISGIAIYLGFLFLNSLFISNSQSGEFIASSAGRAMMHTSGRSMFWERSITEALNNPWLGSGPTQYACNSDRWFPAHPHSFPMQILGEWGVVAAALLIIITVIIGLKFLKNFKAENPAQSSAPILKATLAISLIAGLIHSCLSGVITMPASQVTLILIGGWVLSLSARTQPRIENLRYTRSSLTLPCILALLVLSTSLNELTHFSERTTFFDPYSPLTPRYWQVGQVCNYNYDNIEIPDK